MGERADEGNHVGVGGKSASVQSYVINDRVDSDGGNNVSDFFPLAGFDGGKEHFRKPETGQGPAFSKDIKNCELFVPIVLGD